MCCLSYENDMYQRKRGKEVARKRMELESQNPAETLPANPDSSPPETAREDASPREQNIARTPRRSQDRARPKRPKTGQERSERAPHRTAEARPSAPAAGQESRTAQDKSPEAKGEPRKRRRRRRGKPGGGVGGAE
jgi:hypothetical protein